MAQTVKAQPTSAAATNLPELLGLGLLRTSWRLFRAHWWELVATASCAYVADHLLQLAAVEVGRRGAVPGLLVFSLIPLVPLVATVLMLLALRSRHASRGGAAAIIAAIGSVLVPFLVVYESQGTLRDDIGRYFNAGFWADYGVTDTSDRIPTPTSPLVLGVVVAAFLLRALGSRIVARKTLWEGPARSKLRLVLRALAGYAEVVWIVLGAVVVRYAVGELQAWWLARRLGRGIGDWWDSLSIEVPVLGELVGTLVAVIASILDGVVTGLVTPLAWLAIGVIIYGLTAADAISEEEIVRAVSDRRRLGAVTRRVSPAVVSLAWRRIADPEGRFGALLGGLAMILRSGFVPVLVFCAVYTVLATGVPYAVWDLARTVFAFDYGQWTAAAGPVDAVVFILTMSVTTPLLAAFADALLRRFGARSQLRLVDEKRSAVDPSPGDDAGAATRQGTSSSI